MLHNAIRLAAVATVLVASACAGETEEVTGDTETRASADSRQADRQDGSKDDRLASDGETDATGPGTTPEGSASEDTRSPGETVGNERSSGVPGGADGGAAGGSAGGAPDGGALAGGGGASPRRPAPDGPPPFVRLEPDPSAYDRYVRLARELGGDVADIADATALASVFCSDPAGSSETYLGGQPLSTYPSDLALVRAFCPDKESQF